MVLVPGGRMDETMSDLRMGLGVSGIVPAIRGALTPFADCKSNQGK
jgi:hypothetical protein